VRKVSLFSLVVFAAITLSLLLFAHSLSTAAHEVAGGRSFCLQVPKNSPYRVGNSYQAASNLLDITPIIMRGENSLYHAILVVDKGSSLALYNWSYRSMSFRTDVRGGDDTARWPILCKTGSRLLGGPWATPTTLSSFAATRDGPSATITRNNFDVVERPD
jgi:hypothetical protein